MTPINSIIIIVVICCMIDSISLQYPCTDRSKMSLLVHSVAHVSGPQIVKSLNFSKVKHLVIIVNSNKRYSGSGSNIALQFLLPSIVYNPRATELGSRFPIFVSPFPIKNLSDCAIATYFTCTIIL